jgi:hypothetical protein
MKCINDVVKVFKCDGDCKLVVLADGYNLFELVVHKCLLQVVQR